MDLDTEPTALSNSTVVKSVNRTFRAGVNGPRPPFLHMPFEMSEGSVSYKDLVSEGNFQGWFAYQKKRPGRQDGIVFSCAGIIFFAVLVNERFLVSMVMDGNDPYLMHTWFEQVEEWLYIQNGKDLPIFWDGLLPSEARRSNPEANEMPIGTLMSASNGRIFLSNAYDQTIASDIIFGNSQTDTTGPQRFTENQYEAEGGYFGTPTLIGPIGGMVSVPRQGTINGQGELLILCRNGAFALETSVSRLLWKDSRIQAITMVGRGTDAPGSVVAINNDIWFKSEGDIASYQLSRSDQSSKFSLTKASRPVNPWLETETSWLRQFTSSIYFDNRLLTTLHPVVDAPSNEDYGSHRYHRGILALDLDQPSQAPGDGAINWDGLWTGIQPCSLLKVGDRAFAFSHDKDGKNRIYEIGREPDEDRIDGYMVEPEWFYITKQFDWNAVGKSNQFEVKRLVGGEVWVSKVITRGAIGVDFRPDNLVGWYEFQPTKDIGPNFAGTLDFTFPRSLRIKFPSPDNSCSRGSPYPVNKGATFQFMIKGRGLMRIDRFRVAMAALNDPNSPVPDCRPDDEKLVVDGNPEIDYAYNLVEASLRQ